MSTHRNVTPLTRHRAFATIKFVAKAVLAGELAITSSELARRLGMAKVTGQGLSSYLNEAAAICADHGLPNVSVLVVSRDSLASGLPMPSEGSFSDGLYAGTGLTKETIPDEQARVLSFDWAAVPTLRLS